MTASASIDIPIKPGVFVGDDCKPDRARLRGTQCRRCIETFFPARAICPRCRSDAMVDVTLGRTGRIAAITHVVRPPRHYAAPYRLAKVDLTEGVRIVAQVDDGDRGIRVGEAVSMTTRPLLSLPDGRRVWGYVFVPVPAMETMS